MKNILLSLVLSAFLGLGFFALSTLPASAEILCFVNCVNFKKIDCPNQYINANCPTPPFSCKTEAHAFCSLVNCSDVCGPCPI